MGRGVARRCGLWGGEMEELLKGQLCLQNLKPLGGSVGGCISNGQSYQTDTGKTIFVKSNSKKEVSILTS